MSVRGEFLRIAGELVGFLERTGPQGGDGWTGVLRDASALAREDVSEGARRTLELLQVGSAPSFESPLEIEEFARLQEHLFSLCRVILGR